MPVRHHLRESLSLGLRAVALAVVLLGLTIPSTALAQETLTTGKIGKRDGFTLALYAIRAQSDEHLSSLTAFLEKRTGSGPGSSHEVDRYDFNKGIDFTIGSRLASAGLKGALLAHRGSITLSFKATGPMTAIPLPSGCSGDPGEQRTGLLRGSFLLKADRLGKVRLKVAVATLRVLPDIFECTGNHGHGSHGTTLAANGSRGPHALYVFATEPRAHGLVQEGVSVASLGSGYSLSHSLTVLAPRSDYAFTQALAAGTLRGAGDLHRGATYRGSRADGGTSQGRLRGDLTATFATIGTVRPFAHGPLPADQFRY